MIRALFSFDGAILSSLVGCSVIVVSAATKEGNEHLRSATISKWSNDEFTNKIISNRDVESLSAKGYVVIDNVLSLSELRNGIKNDLEQRNIVMALTDSPNGDNETRTDKLVFISKVERDDVVNRRAVRTVIDPKDEGEGLLRAQVILRGVAHALYKRSFAGFAELNTQDNEGDWESKWETYYPMYLELLVPEFVQLSVYAGNGSHYKAHRDGVASSFFTLGLLNWLKLKCYRRRRITAILYLNNEEDEKYGNWNCEEHGGGLRLFLGAKQGDEKGTTALSTVDIAPVGGRLVLFDSQNMLHEVLPVYRQRSAITCWFTV